MTGATPRQLRVVGAILLLCGVALACVVTHLQWVRMGERAYMRELAELRGEDTEDLDDAKAERARAEKRYRAADRSERVGTTTLRIRKHSGRVAGGWRITAEHRLALRPGDAMVTDLRSDRQELDDWIPFDLTLTGDDADCAPMDLYPRKPRAALEQSGPEATVLAYAASTNTWSGDLPLCSGSEPQPDADMVVTLSLQDGAFGEKRLYDRWTLVVDSAEHPSPPWWAAPP